MKHLNLILLVAISTLPIYLLSSGNLQPAHYFLAIYCIAYMVSRGIGYSLADTILLIVAGLVLVREGLDVAYGATLRSLLPAAHIAYSLIIFNALRRAMSSQAVLRVLLLGILISAVVAVGGVIVTGYTLISDAYVVRPVGTFRNANQVGYFAVCLFSLAFYFRLRLQLAAPLLIFLVACSFFLAIVSLSKAAMIGIAVGSLFAGFALTKQRNTILLGSAVALLVIIGMYWFYSTGSLDEYSFVQRLEGLGSENDDSLTERGYGLILEADALTLLTGFGYAETMNRLNHEVHSTIFGFFVHYGVFAGVLFLAFISLWVLRIWRTLGIRGLLLVVSPVMLYGITHNGSRFAIFWVLLALSFADIPNRMTPVKPSRSLASIS